MFVSVGKENLPAGYSIPVSVSGELTDPGEIETYITEYKILDGKGNDITENYEVECVPGKLIVMKVKITIESASAEREYDGSALKAEKCWISSGQLVDGHRLVAKGIGKTSLSEEDGGDPINYIEYAIYDENGKEVSKIFYDIELVYGQLIIK